MKKTDYEIAWRGQLTVNVPVIIIMLSIWCLLVSVTEWNVKLCLAIAFASAWIYWDIMIDRWISWALEHKVDKTRLSKIGKRNLLVWSPFRVERLANKK